MSIPCHPDSEGKGLTSFHATNHLTTSCNDIEHATAKNKYAEKMDSSHCHGLFNG